MVTVYLKMLNFPVGIIVNWKLKEKMKDLTY